jgi:cyclopropane fatty-acyl-phospholipid synthase-like methyltransferase
MIYLITLIFLVLFLLVTAIFYVCNVFATFKGSPFVPTSKKELKIILKSAQLKRGQRFIDLGCGDGRLVEHVAKEYGVKAEGVDLNVFLITLARIRCKFLNIPAKFEVKNISDVDLKKYDVIFVFLMPKFLQKLETNLTSLTPGSLLISHGFKIPYLSNFLTDTIDLQPFSTYFYKIK